MDAHSAGADSLLPLEWIRKRDGEVARFDVQKLAGSLQRAASNLCPPPPAESVAELTRMALFFLNSNRGEPVPTSDEIADWVEKSLRETNHGALADAYADYRQRKLAARSSLPVRAQRDARDLTEPAQTYWDKSRIVQALRLRLHLDSRRSRGIASAVERHIILGRFDHLTTELIRELINAELNRWGVEGRLAAPGDIRLNTLDVKRMLEQPGGPSIWEGAITRRVWQQFSMHEVVSRDVSDAERCGLLRVLGLGAPACLAAACVDCGSLVRQARSSRGSIAQFAGLLAQWIDSCSLLVTIDRIEAWLALIAEPADTPARLAEHFWAELRSRLRYGPLQCVLNLYGGFPGGTDFEMGAGPLFRQQPVWAEREFAGAVAQEILDLFRRDSPDWLNLRVDWHWYTEPDPVQTALLGRVLRLIEEGRAIGIVFDREPVAVGDGLRRSSDGVRPVLDFVGVSLPHLWRAAGCPRSMAALEGGLKDAVGLAVRSTVQKREFIRRVRQGAIQEWADQALVGVFPIGLDWTVRQIAGQGVIEDDGALALGETLLRFMRDAAEREARHFAFPVVVDQPSDLRTIAATQATATEDAAQSFAGVSPGGTVERGLRRTLYAGGRLHAVVQAGTLSHAPVATPPNCSAPLGETIDWAARHTALVRWRLNVDRHAESQTMVRWPEQ